MAKTDKNTGWPGFFRSVVVLCAIMLLLAQSGQSSVASGSGAWQVLHAYEGLTSWAIPAMFMLWGMFALEAGKPSFSASMLGLALPAFCKLVFWGALYAVAAMLLSGDGVSLLGVWRALVSAAKGNTHYHLWVFYPLIGLYLVHPVIHRFVSTAGRGEIRYFLALCFLFASVLPMWSAFRPDSVIAALLERLRIHLVLGWTGCYVGGWYLRRYTIGRIPEFILYVLGILGMVLTLVGNRIFGGGGEVWHLYTSPNVVLTAAALCTLFRYVLGVSEERSRRRTVHRFGEFAMGIYLFHQIWVLIFRWMGISLFAFSPVVSVPFFAVVFFLLSMPFAWLLGCIPGVGNYLT